MAKSTLKAKASGSKRPATSQVELTSPPLIFISHDSRDAKLAEAFSKLLTKISAGLLKSFRSSDKKGAEGIEFGVEWYPEVMAKIDSATDVVCLLTPRSLDRPWILYEAGVAKGKRNTPVYGVAIGVSLDKAATGPFAQFQNCQDDVDSLVKLAFQLLGRISGAEPDKDTVKTQVEQFRTQTESSVKEYQNKPKGIAEEVQGSSVAKLFEEIKVMFRDLPSRLDQRSDRAQGIHTRLFRPEMLFEMENIFKDSENVGLGLLVLASLVRDEFPWLYELALEAYHAFGSRDFDRAESSLRRFSQACALVTHHPFFKSGARQRDLFVVLDAAELYIERLHKRLQAVSGDAGRVRKRSSAFPAKDHKPGDR